MQNPPIDLTKVWEAHIESVLSPRDDGTILHASDLHSCAYALHQRLSGVAQLPFGEGTFAAFERGHQVEARLHETLVDYAEPFGLFVLRGETVEYEGIVGNLDFVLYDEGNRPGEALAIIDLSTTAAKTPDWKYGHALKSAFYAVAKGCDTFCEWVFCFGFGGLVMAQKAHWFSLDEPVPGMVSTWRESVAAAIGLMDRVAGASVSPPPEPPVDPLSGELETWRCGKPGSGKSYCQARCPRNAAYNPANDAACAMQEVL